MKSKLKLMTMVLALSTYPVFALSVQEKLPVAEILQQEDFKAISNDALPQAVLQSLATDYPDWSLAKAYVNKEEVYKLEVRKTSGETAVLYADKDGNWIEI